MGKKKAPFYRIVVADARSPRDGKFIEEIGTYDPNQNPSMFKVDEEAAKEVSQDAIARVVSFMREDDETFFRRSVQGLSLSEIEEFLKACPEFRPFWNQDKNGC